MSALAEIQRRIESTGALISRYESAVARDPATTPSSLFANIRALEKTLKRLDIQFQEVTQQMGLEVYRYRLLNESQPTLVGVAEAWEKLQALFNAAYTANTTRKAAGKGKKLSPVSVPAPMFGFGYTFAGSVGVVMTIPAETENLIGESVLKSTSDTVFDLIESVNVNEIATTLGPAPIRALSDLIDVHSRNRFGLGLEWRYRGSLKRTVELEFHQLERLRAGIAEAKTTSTMQINGELFAVDTQKRQFKLEGDDGVVIEGIFSTAIGPEHEASIPARYRATILKTTTIVLVGGEAKSTISLEALERI